MAVVAYTSEFIIRIGFSPWQIQRGGGGGQRSQFCYFLSLNPYLTESIYLNFHPLEVVSRYRDPQLKVGENYSCLFNLR